MSAHPKEVAHSTKIRLEYLDGRVSRNERQLFIEVFGDEALEYLKGLNNLKADTCPAVYLDFLQKQEEAGVLKCIDDHFFDWVCKMFPEVCKDPREFVNRMLDEAKQVQSEIISTLFFPEFELVMSLRSSVQAMSAMPHQWIEYLSSRSAPISFFETMRTLLLALICAQIDWRTHADELDTHLSKFQQYVDIMLTSGKLGESSHKTLYSQHGDENEVIAWAPCVNELPDSKDRSRIKSHQLSVRHIQDPESGRQWRVVTNTRKKSLSSAVLKALERARNNPDLVVEAMKDVRDMIGMQFIVIGDESDADSLMEYIQSVFSSPIAMQRLNIKEIRRKDGITGVRKANNFNFRRLKIGLNGLSHSTDFEVIVKSLKDHLDAENHIGKQVVSDFSLEWNGAAHVLKEVQRIGGREMLKLLFPDRLYRQNGFDKSPYWYVQTKVLALIRQLRTQNTVDFD